MNDEMPKEERYLTDNRDYPKRTELVITEGKNGDWYVAVVLEGQMPTSRTSVRVEPLLMRPDCQRQSLMRIESARKGKKIRD